MAAMADPVAQQRAATAAMAATRTPIPETLRAATAATAVQAAALQVWADQLPVSVERRRMALMGTQAPLEVLAATAALVATVEMAVQAATAVPANRQPQA